MTAIQFGHSRWAVAAGAVLLVPAVLALAFGLFFVYQGVTYDDVYRMGYGVLAAVAGGLLTAFGGLAVASAVGIWRHRAGARYAGLLIAGLGALVSGMVLPTAFYTRYGATGVNREITVELGLDPTSVIVGLSFFPFIFVLVGLVLGGRHFRRGVPSST